nr:hypothetical protein [Tanacetum cinerariifolium]
MEKIFDVMGCEDTFKTRLAVYKFESNALAWWKAYKQAKGGDAWLITMTWADFKKLFFLQFFPRAEQGPAGTEEEQAKNFQWGLQRQKSGDRHQPTSQQSSHMNHDHNNDRHGSDRRCGSDNHRSSNNNYSGNNNRGTGVSSPTDMPILVPGCEDAFKTRLAVYKFEGNALAWWKAYKQANGGDAWLITVTWADFKKLFFLQFFPRSEQERLKREYHSIRQMNTETSTEFMSTLNHLMCMSYTDVAQVANAARNYEILHERDDDDTERPDKRQKSGDRHQPTSQQSSHRNHGHNNDRHGSDRRSGGDNHRSNNNYSGSNNRLNFKSIQSSSTHEHDPNITA